MDIKDSSSKSVVRREPTKDGRHIDSVTFDFKASTSGRSDTNAKYDFSKVGYKLDQVAFSRNWHRVAAHHTEAPTPRIVRENLLGTALALKTTSLLIAAVVLALGTVQRSLAVWNLAASSGAGTAQAADVALLPAAWAGAEQRLFANGVPATATLPAITNLQPGPTRTVPMNVTNATNAGNGAFRIRIRLTASTPLFPGRRPQNLRPRRGSELRPAARASSRPPSTWRRAHGPPSA